MKFRTLSKLETEQVMGSVIERGTHSMPLYFVDFQDREDRRYLRYSADTQTFAMHTEAGNRVSMSQPYNSMATILRRGFWKTWSEGATRESMKRKPLL